MPNYTVSENVDSLMRVESYNEIVELLNVPSFDDNGNIVANAIVLTDTGSVALTEGALGLNSNGDLIKHNGIDDGDCLPIASFSTKIVGTSAFTGSQASTAWKYVMGSFIIPPSRAVAGGKYKVTGSVTVACTSGSSRIPNFRMGFVPIMSLSSAQTYLGKQDGSGPTFLNYPDINMTIDLAHLTASTFTLSAGRSNNFGPEVRLDINGEPGEIYFGSYTTNAQQDTDAIGAMNQANQIVAVFANDTEQPRGTFDLRWNFEIDEID